MKQNTLRRILALVLAFAMFGSDLALVTSANDSATCGIADHVHTDACYASVETVPATETAPVTEPAATETTPASETVPATEPAETTPVTEAPVETTPATEPAATETTPDVETEPTEVVTDEAMAATAEDVTNDYYYFDLYAGKLTVTGSNGTTTLTGYRFDGNSTAQQVIYTVTGTDPVKVYVYQSNHQEDYQNTGIINGEVKIPNPARVDGWGTYITNRTDVEQVISAWIDKGRPSTVNNIHVTGTVNCEMVLDNLYSTFQTYSKARQDGGIGFVTASSTINSSLTLKIKGDNRFGNIYYCSNRDKNNRIIFEDYPDQAAAGTLTIANIKKNSNGNYWCAAIGGNDDGGLEETCDGIVINSGTIFTGTNAKDDCAAIGGGGNGYGGVTINGGTVTAVVTSSGAAIGGGIGKTSTGGPATVTITGGTIYAYNNSCESGYSTMGVKYIPAAAIGGGSSAKAKCEISTVNISGGTVFAQSVGGTAIGGGSSADNNGGDCTINITGGTIEAYSIPGTIDGQSVPAGVAIGGGTGYNKGGSATLTVSGDAVLRTGSIGGGGFGNKTNANGVIGFAKVYIRNGNIRGQVVMEGTGSLLEMSGGTINNAQVAGVNYDKCYFVKENGGAACVETGTVNISGTALIQNASATWGGAIYLSNGDVTMSDGTIENCSADFGGAVYVSGGNFTMTGGTIDSNQATAENSEGGAVYVTGGNIFIGKEDCGDNTCLTVSNNSAVNGGAFAVAGATPVMYCGTVTGNTADEKGGALYVSGSGGFTMNGGIIDGGSAEKNAKLGGGVYLAGGAFTLNGSNAYVQNNHAENGAGVYLAGGQPNLYKGSMTDNTATGDGGGIYIDKREVNLKPTGLVTVTGNSANRGGGIFIGGTNGTDAGFSVDSTDGGTVNLSSNMATAEGGAVCISNGYFTLNANNITLQDNQAASGGAVAVLSGNFTMSDGAIGAEGHGNRATNGGAVYVNGGDVALSGGTISHNTAQSNGGGIAVDNGNVIMSGGSVSHNQAKSGSGGGMYITSTSAVAKVKVFSGHIAYNSALGSGGAVAVKGSTESDIKVHIGVNETHPGGTFDHTETEGKYAHSYCPDITNNTSGASGGAFYITGGSSTNLNMYCLVDGGNIANGDSDINDVHLSDFLMVNGGKVVITTASVENSNCPCEGKEHNHTNNENKGKAAIKGSVHVTGGTLDLYGNMDNPSFEKNITVDTTKEEDHYYDHRDNKENIKLVYHENFNYNGVIDSTYTAIDLKVGDPETISDSLYQHDGYRIYGWNTDPEATPNTKEGWYEIGKTYRFVKPDTDKTKYPLGDASAYHDQGDLTLYAIWEPNGYWVHYDPNASTYTGESMPDQQFTYNVYDYLRENTYGRVGYTFEGWRYANEDGQYVDDEGKYDVLADEARVINLTKVRGGTVELKAIWEPCDHTPANFAYKIEVESDQKKVLIKTCLDCQYKATATLTAEDAVYDGSSHPAKVVCSDTEWLNITSITYTGTKIGKTDSVLNPQLVTNAGNYTASITADSTTVSVAFTIAKADQPGPTVKPTYTEPEDNSNILKVHPLESEGDQGVNLSPVTHLPVEFVARYYEGEVLQETGWHTIAQDGNTYKDTEITLNEELKYYFVYARYPGNDNYNPSPEVMADGTFLWEGGITLIFIVDPGITYYPSPNNSQLQINVMVDDDHYLTGGKPTVSKENDSDNRLIITVNADRTFIISKNPEVVSTDPVVITIRIGTSVPKPVITSAVQEKQIFDKVVNDTDPCISRDSAYTVAYTVTNYDQATYQEPVLTFNQSVPAETTVIMMDKSNAKTTYWSYAFKNAGSSVELDDFTRMGSSEKFDLENTYNKLQLQFVVDFSRATGSISGENLKTTLSIAKKTPVDEGAPDLATDENATVTVNLSDETHSLVHNEEESKGLTQKFAFTYAAGDAASKWDNRELALLVEVMNPPVDAKISAQVNNTWHVVNSYEPGKFIVPMGTDRSGTVSLTLVSDMIPVIGGTYEAAFKLYAVQSIAEAAPLNGTDLCTATCTFKKADQNVAVSIKTDGDLHLFTAKDAITVTVNTNLHTGYTLKLQLEQLDDNGVYMDKGRRSTSLDNNQYRFELNDLVPDSYRILAIVEDEGGFAVLEAPYYFIIE